MGGSLVERFPFGEAFGEVFPGERAAFRLPFHAGLEGGGIGLQIDAEGFLLQERRRGVK